MENFIISSYKLMIDMEISNKSEIKNNQLIIFFRNGDKAIITAKNLFKTGGN